MRNMTKRGAILNALKNGDRLTHMKALGYGTHRLAADIHALRGQGYRIDSIVKRDATGRKFTEYFMPNRVSAS